MSKRILVTGSNGFIGGYLVEELLARGYTVVGLDNFSKYGRVSKSFDSNSNFIQIFGDASDQTQVYDALEGCEHFIAGAAMIGGISYFHTYAYDLLDVNNRITGSSIRAGIQRFKEGSLRKITFISSSMVFESTSHWPSKEGDETLIAPPISSYGFQKLAVEYYARAALDQYGLPFTIVRPFNCVGIGESRALGDVEISSGNVNLAMSHVVPDLVQKVLKGQDPLHILGSGEQVRHYTYGGDLARGIAMTLEADVATNNDFNISTATGHTVLELAKTIWGKIHGTTANFRYVCDAGFKNDVQLRIPDVSKAKSLLGFEAETELEQMLDEVIPWIRQAMASGRI